MDSDLTIYTGLGLAGRSLLAVRTCDATLFIAGGIGTLSEMTAAHDEGKLIGVLSGSGGISEKFPALLRFSSRKTGAQLIFSRDPRALVRSVVRRLRRIAKKAR